MNVVLVEMPEVAVGNRTWLFALNKNVWGLYSLAAELCSAFVLLWVCRAMGWETLSPLCFVKKEIFIGPKCPQAVGLWSFQPGQGMGLASLCDNQSAGRGVWGPGMSPDLLLWGASTDGGMAWNKCPKSWLGHSPGV